MTTPAAAALYLAQHNLAHEGHKYAVYNPHNKPLEELPVIYGWNNGGSADWWKGQLIAQDGTALGSHLCSHEDYMLADLGILEGTREDRHTEFQAHYPEGYRMEFVRYKDACHHEGLQAAFECNRQSNKEGNR